MHNKGPFCEGAICTFYKRAVIIVPVLALVAQSDSCLTGIRRSWVQSQVFLVTFFS